MRASPQAHNVCVCVGGGSTLTTPHPQLAKTTSSSGNIQVKIGVNKDSFKKKFRPDSSEGMKDMLSC